MSCVASVVDVMMQTYNGSEHIIKTLRAFRQAWKSELAEKHYCILFYMSLVGSVGIVGMDDLF